MQRSETLKTHPLFYQGLTLKHPLLEVRENYTVFSVDEDLATARLTQQQLVHSPRVLSPHRVAVVPLVFLGAEVVVPNLPRTIVLVLF